MSTVTFPLLKLPAEIRAQIYTFSFEEREAPFKYHMNQHCIHNDLQMRLFFAFKSLEDRSRVIVQDLTFDGCSRRTRRPHVGFLALRLASHQLYEETYHFIKLPPINLRTHGIQINELSIGPFLKRLDGEYLRNHVKELSIGFHPICKHTLSPLLGRNSFGILSNFWVSMMRLFWKDYGMMKQQFCSGDRGATIEPLAELLATFPLLKTFRVNVVPVCLFPYNLDVTGGHGLLDALRNRGVDVVLEFKIV